MATFKKFYYTHELLRLIKRETLLPFCWSDSLCFLRFFMVDCRRVPFIYVDDKPHSETFLCNHPDVKNVSMHFISHKSNYYRLVKKIKSLPFDINVYDSDNHNLVKSYELLPYSTLRFNVLEKLNQLDAEYSGRFQVRVIVL